MISNAIEKNCLIRDISPRDTMFEGNDEHYFSVGTSAIESIELALRAARKPVAHIRRILDLPCGHGRVLRHLRHCFPEATIVACDLDRDGVDYCASTFGAIAQYSEEDPTRVPLEKHSFDLIWVGSLFTHLDEHRWAVFLDFFRSCLRPAGVLVFSSHGRLVQQRLVTGEVPYGTFNTASVIQSHERTGFGYKEYPEVKNYGFSLTHPSWVLKETGQMKDLRLVHFCEKAWDDHHDVFAFIREPHWLSGSGKDRAEDAVVMRRPA